MTSFPRLLDCREDIEEKRGHYYGLEAESLDVGDAPLIEA
jgi:hypothetical protein